jgi:protein TonB
VAFGVSLGLHAALVAAVWLGARFIPLPAPTELLPVELLHGDTSEAPAAAPRPPAAPAPALPPPPIPAPPRRSVQPAPRPTRPAATGAGAAPPEASLAPAAAGSAAGDRVYGESEVDRVAAPQGAIAPVYPSRQRALGREGTVVLRVTVEADGRARDLVVVMSAGDEFDAAAREAASAARFRPALRAGQPVASSVTLRVRFHLQ